MKALRKVKIYLEKNRDINHFPSESVQSEQRQSGFTSLPGTIQLSESGEDSDFYNPPESERAKLERLNGRLEPLGSSYRGFPTFKQFVPVSPTAYNYASSKPYNYATLRNVKNIRIVRMKPADLPSDPIVCTLQTINLARFRTFDTFEAVSYLWGPTDLSRTLFIDDNLFLNISKRLHDVLSRIRTFYSRPRGEMPPIWVDAVCIDQLNDAERSSQVQQMAEIYQRAERVHVFLSDILSPDWSTSE